MEQWVIYYDFRVGDSMFGLKVLGTTNSLKKKKKVFGTIDDLSCWNLKESEIL